MQATFVRGFDEDAVFAQYTALGSGNNTSSAGTVGFGLDSTSAYNANSTLAYLTVSVINFAFAGVADYAGFPGRGKHTLAALEANNTGTGTMTFYGAAGNVYRTGIVYDLRA
jgi:hypothetical protein